MTKANSEEKEKEETYVYLSPSAFRKKNEEACHARLLECMNADKLEPSLKNGFITENKEEFDKLREVLGRRRNFSYYFTTPYTGDYARELSKKPRN